MDNVESADGGRRPFPTTRVLTADGVVSLIGCLMGNPFINAVYIGHPGWKAMGGRIGYSAATGVMVIVLCWFGIISLLLALVPLVAISPILLYIGMLIGAQAFQTTPAKPCARHRAGADAASGGLGQGADRSSGYSRRGRGGPLAPRCSCQERRRCIVAAIGRALSRARTDGRRRDPGRAGARRHRRVRHRAQFLNAAALRLPAPC